MHSILVIGAGKIGSTIADMLHETGDYRGHRRGLLRRGARSGRQGRRQDGPTRLQRRGRPAECPEGSLRRAQRRALPPDRPCGEGGAADGRQLFRPDRGRRHHPHGEGAGRRRRRRRSFPQCGLAPGFISIVAHDIASRFDKLDTVRLRVGALPQYPSNALSYNLTWSTDGVINEYIERCEAVVDGTPARGPGHGRAGGILPRRHPLRGLQHLRRPRHAVRDASKARCAT